MTFRFQDDPCGSGQLQLGDVSLESQWGTRPCHEDLAAVSSGMLEQQGSHLPEHSVTHPEKSASVSPPESWEDSAGHCAQFVQCQGLNPGLRAW